MADHARNKRFFSASTLLMLAIAACMSASLVWHEPIPAAWRIPLTAALVLFSLCITSMRVLVTRKPDLPFAFVRAGGYVSSAFLSLFWLVLLKDAALGLAFLAGAAFPGLAPACYAALRALHSVPFELSLLAAAFGMAAVGMALAAKIDGKDYRTYTIVGDGESEEGQVWEALMFAARHKLDNLCVTIDYNGLQIDGPVAEIVNPAPYEGKLAAFGYHVITIDAHDYDQIEAAFTEAKTVKGQPTAIVANSVKGKGVSFMENQVKWHGAAPNDEQYEQAMAELRAQL